MQRLDYTGQEPEKHHLQFMFQKHCGLDKSSLLIKPSMNRETQERVLSLKVWKASLKHCLKKSQR